MRASLQLVMIATLLARNRDGVLRKVNLWTKKTPILPPDVSARYRTNRVVNKRSKKTE